jgi:hypothetical protein
MVNFPASTIVDRRVPKQRFYDNISISPGLKRAFVDQISLIIWRNKLVESTLTISAGKDIHEIQIFELQLRQKELDRRVLASIAGAIPYKIVFVLVYGGAAQAWMEISGTFYSSDWQPLEEFTLTLEGLNLDIVYANLARQISGGRLGSEGDISEAVERDKRRQKLKRDIAALEKKVQREKQFNKQVEWNGELRKLKLELEEL